MSDAVWAVLISAVISIIGIILNRFIPNSKDRTDYGQNLLKIANDATDALESSTEKHDKEMKEIRASYENRISTLETKILQLESTQQRYTITLELVSNGKPTLVSHRVEDSLTNNLPKK